MNFKKFISFILAVSLSVCAVFSFSTFAHASAPVTVSVSADASAGLIEALGIDVVCKNETGVTRGEFVYALMQTLRCSLSELPALPYEDVNKDDFFASSLRYALALRVVSAANNFNGNSPVTWQQAAKMMVTALGRDIEASLKGGWPYGYISVAYEAGLDEGLSLSNETNTLSINDVYVLLENFLKSYMYEINGIYGENFNYSGERTVMEIFYNITVIEGIITANSHTSLYNADASAEENCVEINEVKYKYYGECHIGDYVRAYIINKSAGSAPQVVYLDNSVTNTLVIGADDLSSVSGGKVEYYNQAGSLKSKSMVQYPAVVYNGKAYPSFDITSLAGSDSRVELVDNNDDGRIDVIRAYQADVMYVDSVDTFKEIIIDKNEGVIDLNAFADSSYSVISSGHIADISAIKPGSVITYYASFDKKLYTITTDSSTVSGVLDEYDSAKDRFIINNEAYSCTGYFNRHYASKVTLGSKVNLLLSANGEIVALASLKSSRYDYGYLIALKKNTGLETGLSVKMFSKKNGISIYKIDEKTLLNARAAANLDSIQSNLQAYIDTADASMANHLNATTPKYTFITATTLVKFVSNDDGYISRIDTADVTGQLKGNEPIDNSLTRYAYPADRVSGDRAPYVYSGLSYIKSSQLLHPYFRLNEETDVFIININEGINEEKKYTCTNGSYFSTHTNVETAKLIAYDVDAIGLVSAVVLYSGSTGGTLNNESASGIVTSVTKALAPNEEQGLKITLLSGGEYNAYYVTDPYVLETTILDTNRDISDPPVNSDATMDNPCIAVGDYIRLECDYRNIVSSMGKDFDSLQKKLLKTFENHTGDEIDYYYGKVYAKGDGLISMIPEMLAEHEQGMTLEDRTRYSFNVSGIVSLHDEATGKVSIASSNEILSYLIAGDSCHNILIKLNKNAAVDDVIIYEWRLDNE